MQKLRKISSFRLSSLLRLQKDPKLAFHLFLNPNPKPNPPNHNDKPFRYSPLSYDLIISKLGRAKMFSELEHILDRLKNDSRIIPEEIIFCNIITYYGRARLPLKALQVFDEIPYFRCQRTIKSVNALLNSLLMCGHFGKIREVLSGIEAPDACTYNIMIRACCMVSDMERAGKLFDEMRMKGIEPNVVTFGTLIHGHCLNLELDKAFSLKGRMERDFSIRPNAHIYVVLIKELCKIGNLNKAIELKDEMLRKKVELDPAVYSTLVSAFYKSGRSGEVSGLLEEMRKHGCKPDTVTYNAMICGFVREKDLDSAFEALREMEKGGCKPDVISYNVIIGGLCRERKVREAHELLEDMPRRKCTPDVVSYRTLFDGLCNVKQLNEAAGVLDEMIFLGYAPRCCSVSKYIDKMVSRKKMELWTYLFGLVKRDSVDRCIWRFLTSLVCEDTDAVACELFNRLINARSSNRRKSLQDGECLIGEVKRKAEEGRMLDLIEKWSEEMEGLIDKVVKAVEITI